jgi:hypothetical protein
MRLVRRALGSLVAVSLSLQLAVVAITPLAFWGSSSVRAAECTCPLGVDAACPMHHKSAPVSKICVMQGAGDQATVWLTSLLSVVGLMPGSTHFVDGAPSRSLVIIERQLTAEHPVPPDPPPPRS